MSDFPSALAEILRARLRKSGPITFRDWMAAALYDSQYGYYCVPGRIRWGRAGDYRTSSERSTLFAATLARYFESLHGSLGSPSAWTIVEAGAGAGNFAQAVLSRSPQLQYIIDERSEHSRQQLQSLLTPFANRVTFRSLESLDSLNPGIVFANELIDAFPVHRVMMSEGRLREFYVAVDDEGRFVWQFGQLSTEDIAEYFERLKIDLPDEHVAEVNLAAVEWLRLAAQKIQRGYLMLVDYGAEAVDLYTSAGSRSGTLRGFSRHEFVDDLLARPGEHDLTTTIDWTTIRLLGEELGFSVVEFERQDRFLLQAGFLEELESMTANADAAQAARLRTEAREMILPSGMAGSFQVLVLGKS